MFAKNGIPLYLQLKEKLLEDIKLNYKVNDIIPAEGKLEKKYEVSRITVRKAIEELEEIKQLASKDGINDFRSSDMAYYSQKLKKAKYDLDEEYYRPYFEQESVLNGFFDFLHQMFDIKFVQTNTKAWDEKVKVYDLLTNEKQTARIYIDLEARKDKRGGAWMNSWHSHYSNSKGEEQLPTAFIVCNFPQSTETTPSLLRHSDVVTLFHEMGHALHHLVSDIKDPYVSGISGVAWDTVEFPSQFLEYFSYDKDVLKLFAKHYETDEIIPMKYVEKIKESASFHEGMQTLRQLSFGLLDMKWHSENPSEITSIKDFENDAFAETKLYPDVEENAMSTAFSHIFQGGYSAGYYSYKWAEVLDADAFEYFLEKGIFNKEVASKFKENVLSKGGTEKPMELYKRFRGQEPKPDALLKRAGLL